MQPLTGELSDIFGPEVSSIFATFLFTIGSLLRRFSTSHEMISLGQVITGVIGGGCTSIAMFIFADRMLPGYKGIWHSVSIYGLTIAGSIILVVSLALFLVYGNRECHGQVTLIQMAMLLLATFPMVELQWAKELYSIPKILQPLLIGFGSEGCVTLALPTSPLASSISGCIQLQLRRASDHHVAGFTQCGPTRFAGEIDLHLAF